MSEQTKDGGPAFPRVALSERENDVGDIAHFGANGMSLRDYFAAKAMQGMCAGNWPDSFERPEIAKRAYLMADDMIAARE